MDADDDACDCVVQPESAAAGDAQAEVAALRAQVEQIRLENRRLHDELHAMGVRSARADQLDAVLDHLPQFVVRVDRDLRHTYVNDLAARMGARLGTALFESGLPPDVAEIQVGACRAAFDTGREVTIEFDLEMPGDPRRIEARHIPEFEPDTPDVPSSVLVLATDVTGHAQLLAEARRQRELVDQLMEVAPIVIAVTRGPEHRFEYVNPAFRRLTRTEGMTAVGRPAADILPTMRRSGTLEIADEVFHTGRPAALREHESRAVPIGLTHWDMDILPLHDSEGQVAGLLVLGHDITASVVARREAEALAREAGQRAAQLDAATHELHRQNEALRTLTEELHARNGVLATLTHQLEAERAWLRAVLEQMPVGVTIATAPSGTTLLASDQLMHICRHSFPPGQDIESYMVSHGLHPDGHPYLPESWPLARALLNGEVVDREEIVIRRGDGSQAILNSSAAPVLDSQGRITAGVAVYQDVTERREMEEALRHARDELELRVTERTAELAEAFALMEQRVEDRTHELTTVLSIAHLLASELRLEPLLEVLLAQLKNLLDYTGATVYSVEGEELRVLDYQGPVPRTVALNLRFPIDQAFGLGQVILERQALVIPDIKGQSDAARGFRRSAHPGQKQLLAGARSLLAVPLVVRDRVIGVLHLDHSQPGYFDSREVQWALALGRQLAVAIDNVRLYEQARELAAVEERQRLARELHDAVSQTLFSASLIADVLPQIWEQDPARVPGLLVDLAELTRGARAEMRTLLMELRPTSLLEVGLDVLLRHLAEATTARGRLRVSVRADDPFPGLPSAVQIAFYRIAQEALNNVAKHSAARVACIDLGCTKRGAEGSMVVHLSVEDDGGGFDPDSVRPGRFGLAIMRERAQEIGATLTIDSQPGCGTRIRVVWTESPPSTPCGAGD
jgi:two-component system nitrate/nitrite sensor histidine kinase NarX